MVFTTVTLHWLLLRVQQVLRNGQAKHGGGRLLRNVGSLTWRYTQRMTQPECYNSWPQQLWKVLSKITTIVSSNHAPPLITRPISGHVPPILPFGSYFNQLHPNPVGISFITHFNTEDGGSTVLRNVSNQPPHHMTQSGKPLIRLKLKPFLCLTKFHAIKTYLAQLSTTPWRRIGKWRCSSTHS